MKIHCKVFLPILSVIIIFSSCTRPQDFGKELLSDDIVGVDFDEFYDIQGRTIVEEPLNYYVANNQRAANRIFVGGFENDIYGRIDASGYFKLYPTGGVDFSGLQIDSAKLILEYDIPNVYGDTLANQQIGVYLLQETLRNDSTFTTGSTLPFDSEPIGISEVFLPQPNTRELLVSDEDTITLSPRISINLNQRFLDLFKTIPVSSLIDNNLFNEVIPGFHLKSEIEADAILSFRLPNSETKIEIYYTNAEGQRSIFRLLYLSSNAAFSHYERNFENSLVNQYLENTSLDEYLFLQGGQGFNMEIELPPLEELKGKTINFAVLEFIVKKFDEIDYTKFPQSNRILASRYTDSGGLAVLPEVAFAIGSQNFSVFGGNEIDIIRDGEVYKAYRFNISNHLQNILDGSFDNKIVFNVSVSAEQFGSVAFFGNGNISKRPVLKVAYTN